jgi:long-chain fatty acid transport protein
MRWRGNRLAICLAAAVLGRASAGPVLGAGFGIFEQGSMAMGMAGSFTAQADDPSAMFHNPGGLAFQKDLDFLVGVTWIRGSEASFDGAAPFPGPGVQADQEALSEFPPHAYWVQPISSAWTFGLGINAPFGLTTEWENPDTFPGRFVSARAALRAIDVNPTLGWQVSPNLGVGFGVIGRFSDVELDQHVPRFNPFTNTTADIATLELQSDFDNGVGFNAGVLYKVNNSLSWGLSYRSEIGIDYSGDARLSQNLTGTPFDPLVAAALPFNRDLPVETSIDFPAMASIGVAMALTQNTLVEADVNWTGWSSFDVLEIDFVDDDLPDATRQQHWDDANNYRLGLSWTAPNGSQWRAGAVYDETPQPEEAVSPLLPDANRIGYTVGYGWAGQSTSFDLAVMYLDFDEAKSFKTFEGEEGQAFFGTYQNKAWLFGLTLGF